MKILYLHQYYTTPSMSGGTRSYEMAKRFAAAGHEVHVITSWRDETEHTTWWSEDCDGVHVHWLPLPYTNTMSYPDRIRAFFRFALQAGRKAVEIGGDVVFATSTPLTIAIPGVRAARRLGVPMVFEVRDLWPELPVAMKALRNPVAIWLARKLERYAYRNSARIVALSPGMAEGVVATGYPGDKVDIIPNSSDVDLFAPDAAGAARFRAAHPELGEGPIVLYAGTFGHINGVGYLAELASRFTERAPDIRFVAIGKGAEYDLVRARARELGVLDRNFFTYPAKPKRELVDAFRAATVSTSLFVDIPEMWHNSANKFFDGLASGTAIAINYQGWQADLLRDRNAGIVLGADPDHGAAVLNDFLSDPERVAGCGKQARDLACTTFNRDILAAQLVKVIERAVRKD